MTGLLSLSCGTSSHAMLELSAPATVVAGVPFTVTVTAIYNGQRDTMINGPVHFTSSDPNAAIPTLYVFTAADAGSHTFTNALTLMTPGSQTLTVSDYDATPIAGTANILVTSSSAASNDQGLSKCDLSKLRNAAFGGFAFDDACAHGPHACAADCADDPPTTADNNSGPEPNARPLVKSSSRIELTDLNRDIYYRNKLEFSLEGGWLPLNVPFPFDVFEGDPYNLYPLRYTLVPIIGSLRWHVDGASGPLILRGNWDVTFSGSATAIPKGAETHYFSYDMGIRRNFVPRNSRVAPYFDIRLGLGIINAKGPLGVYYAQGQNFTFTCNMGSGVRYNFNPRYAISAGLNWMHISNANLSSPQYSNYGINVYGPMFGLDVQLGRHSRHGVY